MHPPNYEPFFEYPYHFLLNTGIDGLVDVTIPITSRIKAKSWELILKVDNIIPLWRSLIPNRRCLQKKPLIRSLGYWNPSEHVLGYLWKSSRLYHLIWPHRNNQQQSIEEGYMYLSSLLVLVLAIQVRSRLKILNDSINPTVNNLQVILVYKATSEWNGNLDTIINMITKTYPIKQHYLHS